MARLDLRSDLEAVVAAKMVRPAVERLLERARDEARRAAPDGKVWITRHDERVRHSHEQTDGQLIPANLRFELPSVQYVRRVGYVPDGGVDLAREPGDVDLPPEQRMNCRCVSATVPQALARTIHAGPVRIAGPLVSGEVATRFPRAAESERGNDGRPGDEAARFMRRALELAAFTTRRR